ncbi:MAG TPA: carboxypeptidase-like regulatory domain-containing protein [Candidatus Sulfotelmatobacter sp.]|nr:carboxypeptidase-like regulatory domain-containing protein [Candidatus Sulfotelmatobacter sp.]
MHSGSRVVTLLVVVVLALSALTVAQSAMTSLRGTVTDPKGAVLQGAIVTLSNASTGYSRTTKSGNDGAYQFLEVPPATYMLTVTSSGFATVKQDRVTLQVSQPATLDVAMQVRGTTEVVEVSSEAPLVNTTDATQGNVFNTTQLLNLPSEGRDPVAILSLQPGVTYIGQNVDQTADSRGGSVAGARSDQTNVTLDGLDNNDQLTGNAFQGALRAPLDSIQEFRVTTSNSNADAGRSSGAQVSLVTKSGTNNFHGGLYEYNRSNLGVANDWFNEQAQVKAGLPNRPGPLVRNTFGAFIGGPIKKDRMFFFADYEGQRTNEASQTTRVVPSDLMRTGIIQYPCDPSDPACAPGFVDPGGNYSVSSDGIASLTVQGLQSTDTTCVSNGTCPWGGGANPNALAIFQKYPSPNSDAFGDGFDYRAFTFAAPTPTKLDTYILKLDYKLTASGNHTLFVKGHLQNFHNSNAPQFPGQPPNDFLTDNSKGLFVGYTALISNTLVNNLRYGFIRQGIGDAGLSASDYNHFRGMDDVQGFSNSVLTNVPVHNIVDDLSWTRGKHTLQFGGNLRFIANNRTGNAQNVSTADTNVFWLDNAGIANTGSSLDPGAFGYPAVDGSFGENYDFATAAIAGLLTETNKTYNQDKTGHFFAPGELITRNFKDTEAEFYVQDAWRVTPNLVLTGGLRYSLLQPPYEVHGNQVAPTISMNGWFKDRATAMRQGQTLNSEPTPIQLALSGQANGKQPYWAWDYKDLAPRLAFAYSPHASSGILHALFGSAGKSSIRGGYGLYFDHFGEGIVNSFDKNGSFGLTTQLVNPAGSQDVDCTPRLTALTILPPANTNFCGQQVVGPPPPALPNPITPPTGFDAGSFAIYWGLDDKLKTPYSHVFDFSITRELTRNFVFEASYVGRLGHRLLQEEDLAMPLDLVDPASKMDYFTAATMLTKAANAGTDISQMAPIPFWEHLFPGAAGQLGFGSPGGTPQHNNSGCAPGVNFNTSTYTPTQAMYDMYSCFAGNETTALFIADLDCLPACAQLPGQSGQQPFNFFDDQFSSLYSWRSIGNSNYHAMQLSLRKAMSSGLAFDFNYTLSKSIDIGSNAERINEFEGFGFASQVINSWDPNQNRAVSDFDTRHQINANFVYELPFGRGRRFGSGMGKVANAVVGGWGLSGIFHWTSGLPFSMGSGSGWPTNWQLQGEAVPIANPGKVGVHRDSNGDPTMWADVSSTGQAHSAFRFPYPGETGTRNELRGPGYFELDNGLWKTWNFSEEKSLKFAWEVFNVTNSVRFDAAQSANQFALTIGNFGTYSNTLSKPRVMQLSLRFSF